MRGGPCRRCRLSMVARRAAAQARRAMPPMPIIDGGAARGGAGKAGYAAAAAQRTGVQLNARTLSCDGPAELRWAR